MAACKTAAFAVQAVAVAVAARIATATQTATAPGDNCDEKSGDDCILA